MNAPDRLVGYFSKEELPGLASGHFLWLDLKFPVTVELSVPNGGTTSSTLPGHLHPSLIFHFLYHKISCREERIKISSIHLTISSRSCLGAAREREPVVLQP